MLKSIFVALALIVVVNGRPSCPGCISDVSPQNMKDVESELNASLSKLAAGDGPSYKLIKINKATRQVVSGSKLVVNADIAEGDKTKTCDITIWSQPWIKKDGVEVTFNCPGEPQLKKKHAP